MPRTGRRPGESGTRTAILDAARAAFADSGYDGATIRAISAAAGVDAALVHHYFGSKEALFTASMQLPIDPATAIPVLLAHGPDGLGERIVRFFVTLWESPTRRAPFLALVRSAVTHERSAELLREAIERQVLGRVAAAIHAPDPALRAALAGSQLVGLAMARYIIAVEPLASADAEQVISAVAPAVQRYLTGDLPLAPRSRTREDAP